MTIFLGTLTPYPNMNCHPDRSVANWRDLRFGQSACKADGSDAPLRHPERSREPALREVEGDLQFSGLVLEMFFDRVLMQVEVKVCRAYGARTMLGNPMTQPFRAGLTFGGRPLRQAQGRLYGPQSPETPLTFGGKRP